MVKYSSQLDKKIASLSVIDPKVSRNTTFKQGFLANPDAGNSNDLGNLDDLGSLDEFLGKA